jgi:hypothetical protein
VGEFDERFNGNLRGSLIYAYISLYYNEFEGLMG